MEIDLLSLAIYLGLATFGFAAQILQRLVDIRNSIDTSMHLGQYLRTWPYATVLALMGSWAGIAVLDAAGQVTAATALLAGYAGNAVFDSKRAKDL